jgi:thiol-disulfide isomerase/thioredoxin
VGKMKKINPWMIITIILVIVIIGLLFGRQITGMFIVLTPQDIANKAMGYLNKNLVTPNTTATFVSVSEFNGLYNVTISYQNQNQTVYITKDGKFLILLGNGGGIIDTSQPLPQPEVPKATIGDFFIDENSDICEEDGKTIVYFFGSQKCPHCMWEDPIIKNVTEKFKDQISFHENIDTDTDKDTFIKYSPSGYIPLTLIGCKYYRIGSGESIGEENEANVLTALICMVTNNNPLSVCAEVEDLINQVS